MRDLANVVAHFTLNKSGQPTIELCDEAGRSLGLQTGATLETNFRGFPTLTVRFAVDGNHVRFADARLLEPERPADLRGEGGA